MQIERYDLRDDGLVPNNSALALVVYRGTFKQSARDAEQSIIRRFAANGWSNAWINGIYAFQHYHATAHEVLGLARGSARVQFGGLEGPVVVVSAGDVVLIPAGVGHCRIDASADLSVVGAYPGGAVPDLQRAMQDARLAAMTTIPLVPPWRNDPVTGKLNE